MQAQETQEMVSYLGRAVPRKGFRAYVYAMDGRQKIAESYDEFDAYIHSDEWFASTDEVESFSKKKRKKTKPATPIYQMESQSEETEDVVSNHEGE